MVWTTIKLIRRYHWVCLERQPPTVTSGEYHAKQNYSCYSFSEVFSQHDYWKLREFIFAKIRKVCYVEPSRNCRISYSTKCFIKESVGFVLVNRRARAVPVKLCPEQSVVFAPESYQHVVVSKLRNNWRSTRTSAVSIFIAVIWEL